MKKLTLLLIAITQIFSNLYGENFDFRDGTFLKAVILNEKGVEPDEHGIILTVNKRVYIHHYPNTKRALSPPMYYLSDPGNPYGMPSCTPSRISFFHFETFNLVGIKETVEKMDIPAPKKKRALEAISKAMSETIPKEMKNPSHSRTMNWKFKVKLRLGGHIKRKVAVWAEDYFLLQPFEKEKPLNSRNSFPIK